MTLPHWSYVAMLAFCLAGTLPLTAYFRLGVLRQVGRLAASIVVASAPFVLWDLGATRAGQWRFDPTQTLPWRVAGLPLEEIGFFVVVPLASVLTFEAVKSVKASRTPQPDRARPADRAERGR